MSKNLSFSEAEFELKTLRKSIDNIDAALIYMLAERFSCTQKVGVLKSKAKLPSADLSREATQISRLKKISQEANLDPIFAEKFLRLIISEVIQNHKKIAEISNKDS